MYSLLLNTFFLVYSLPSFATSWTGIVDCGTYQVKGIARSTKNGLLVVVNEKTLSEFTVILPISNEAVVAPYLDQPLVAVVLIEKKPTESKILGTIKEIHSRIPNPLAPLDTGMTLIKKARCKK